MSHTPHIHAHTHTPHPNTQLRLSEEYDRCAQYLDVSTRKPLIAVVEKQLVSQHLAALLERGFSQVYGVV